MNESRQTEALKGRPMIAQGKAQRRPGFACPHNSQAPKGRHNRRSQDEPVSCPDLSKAFALAVPHEAAIEIRDEVGFFQTVRAVLAKGDGEKRKSDDEMNHAIRQIISRAVASDEVVDILAAAGLKKPVFQFCLTNSSPKCAA